MAKKKGKKQEDLPGVEGAGVAPVSIPELDKAAAEYVNIRDRRMELTPKEVKAKDKLSELMHAHEDQLKGPDGTLRYVYDDQEVILEPAGEKLKVRSYQDPGAPE